jgi:hypothetical protein
MKPALLRLNANKGLIMKRLLFCSALILAVPAAQAQNPQPTGPENPTVTVAPQNAPSPPPEKIAPSGSTTLSDQLSKGRGTVVPPKTNMDPGMAISPPTTSEGRMPVIPPPGSPGGNTTVVPK